MKNNFKYMRRCRRCDAIFEGFKCSKICPDCVKPHNKKKVDWKK